MAAGNGRARGPARTLSLYGAIQRSKSFPTAQYRKGVRDSAWPAYEGRLWQRNHWERIIRSEREPRALHAYIKRSPAHWAQDRLNPAIPRSSPTANSRSGTFSKALLTLPSMRTGLAWSCVMNASSDTRNARGG